MASDKDTCVLKCHVFHCNVPAKGIAKALHEMCSKVGCRGPGRCGHGSGGLRGEGRHGNSRLLQIVAERAVASSRLPRSMTLEPVCTKDLPLQGTVPPELLAAPPAQSPPSGSRMPSDQSPLAFGCVWGSLGMGVHTGIPLCLFCPGSGYPGSSEAVNANLRGTVHWKPACAQGHG